MVVVDDGDETACRWYAGACAVSLFVATGIESLINATDRELIDTLL